MLQNAHRNNWIFGTKFNLIQWKINHFWDYEYSYNHNDYEMYLCAKIKIWLLLFFLHKNPWHELGKGSKFWVSWHGMAHVLVTIWNNSDLDNTPIIVALGCGIRGMLLCTSLIVTHHLVQLQLQNEKCSFSNFRATAHIFSKDLHLPADILFSF